MATFSEQGRWGGKLTARPLPLGDPSVDRLTDGERHQLAAVWIGRAASERRVADSFDVMNGALIALRADPALVVLAKRAVDDEYRHAEISRVVASRFAGTELPPPAHLPLRVPEHHGASEELRHTLHIVGHCALNETTAGAFLETCIDHAEGELAKAALRELLSDEIDHARMGWAHLAAAPMEIREGVGKWIYPMVRANLRFWRETPRPEHQTEAMARHGAPPAEALEEALVCAVQDLILPGLKALDVPTERIEQWMVDGASTAPIR